MWASRKYFHPILVGDVLLAGRKCFVSVAGISDLIPIIEKSRVVKTNPLAKQFWMRRMALCICDAATDRRMGNGMPIGRWWSRIEPRVGRVSAWLPILGS
jgi:hypothetical protein